MWYKITVFIIFYKISFSKGEQKLEQKLVKKLAQKSFSKFKNSKKIVLFKI